MKKNDITYEYRVFTHRPIDVESMEVGRCTSKVIKELKPSDKVDGRFFHTSDTDEWFFCWNGNLHKLNLKGNADVNAALEEVNRLIVEANIAVEDAKKTAGEAKDAATAAAIAADAATAAVESIENKADKTVVDELSQAVNDKADKTVVDELVNNIADKADASDVKELSDKVSAIKIDEFALRTEIPSLDGYATETFVSEEVAKIVIPEVPTKVSSFENDVNYLTSDIADLKYAPIGSGGVDLNDYATKEFVGGEIEKIKIPTKVSELENDSKYLTEHQDITGKQDTIADLETIRSGAALGATALQAIPSEYVTETELDDKGYLTEQSLKGYATETFVSEEIGKLVIPEVPSMDEYAKKSDLDEYAKKSDIPVIPSLDDYALKSDIPSLDGYAKTTDIPSLDGYALKSDIPSMDNYFTKDEINTMIGDINALIGQATALADTILNA